MKKLIFALLFTFACTAIFAIAYTAKWNEEWKKLTEEEQWFCLLSEPLTERNALSIISVNPEPFVPEGKQSHSQGILENSWQCFSKEELIATAEEFWNGEEKVIAEYNFLKSKVAGLQASPASKVTAAIEKLAAEEILDFSSIARLYYIVEMQDILGENGLLAWNYGKLLAGLRWGIGAGWLTEAEALDLAKPFIDFLLNAFDSWEDYAVHYAFGRAYYALQYGLNYTKYFNEALEDVRLYDIEVEEDEKDKIFTFHGIKFPGLNVNGNRILTYSDAVYKPSKEAELWMLTVRQARHPGDVTDLEYASYLNFLKKKKHLPRVAYNLVQMQRDNEWTKTTAQIDSLPKPLSDADLEKRNRLVSNTYKKDMKFYDEANASFKKADKYNPLYIQFYMEYAVTSFQAGDYKKYCSLFTDVLSGFEEEIQQTADIKNFTCLYYLAYAEKEKHARNYEDCYRYTVKALDYLNDAKTAPSIDFLKPEQMGAIQSALFDMLKDCEENLAKENRRRQTE